MQSAISLSPASVAQLVEQCPFKAFVVGSNPTGCILQFTSMKGIVMYCNYFVFDNLDDSFLSVSFASSSGAEAYIEKELDDDTARYSIYKKLS